MGSVSYLRRERHEGAAPAEACGESLLRPGYNCCAVARAARFALLIDGEAYFRAFREAALRAERSITILGWDFNSQALLHHDPVEEGGPPAKLGDFLNYLARRRRRLNVNILNWDYPMVFGMDREFPPLYGFGWRPHRRVHMRYDDSHPVGGSQHQKIVVIDDRVAFVGGIDLTVRRWDTPAHRPDDPRRVAYDEPYAPFHDMMALVDGDAACELAKIAQARWELATGHRLKSVAVQGDPWPAQVTPLLEDVEVGIARTAPQRGETPAVREIERLYLDTIRAARHTLYIENQYFTAPVIAQAVAERLAEPDGPEVVLVLRLLSHGWLEEHTMHVLRSSMVEKLRAADRHGRFHVYYPHVDGLPPERCIDVHSKLMIADDQILRVGSSNLCNRSMSFDTECDVLVEARGEERIAAAIRGVRARLLGEHLGVPPAAVERRIAEDGSLHAAIAALRNPARCLRNLEEQPWPEALVNAVAVADPQEPVSLDFLGAEREDPAAEAPVDGGTHRPAWGKLAAIAAVFAALFALWHFTPVSETVNGEKAVQWAQDVAGPWEALGLILLYIPVALVMFPRPLLTLVAVIAYGPFLGFGIAMTGIVASAVFTYYMGRRMRRDTVRRLAGDRAHGMVEVLRKRGLLAMTLLRLVPLAPFMVEGIIAGAARLPMWQLALGTFLGMLPGALAATIFGAEIESVLLGAGEFNWWLVGGVLAVLGVGAFAVRRWFRKVEGQMKADGAPSEQPG